MAAIPKLIVLAAFDENEEGELLPAFEPREMQTEERATYMAKIYSLKHDSVIAWSRDADPARGEFGEAKVLFQKGRAPGDGMMLKQNVQPLADETSEIATEILIWLSGKPDVMRRFLDLSGIQPDEIRAHVVRLSFQAGLLAFVMNHEPDLLDFSAERGIPAERVARCHERHSSMINA